MDTQTHHFVLDSCSVNIYPTTTLNKLAVNPDSSWHELSELDWRTGSAITGETRLASDAIATRGLAIEALIFAVNW